jgi:hypothetical protein
MHELLRSLRVCYLTISLALVVGSGSPAAAQESYTELLERGLAEPQQAVVEHAEVVQIGADALTFFDDPDRFAASCPTLPLEDFENTNAPGGTVVGCSTSINSSTNDACYAPDALIAGFTLTSIFGYLVVLTPPAFGVTSVVAGPDSFAADSEITFSDNDVTGVGVDLLTGVPLPGGTIDIEIFESGNVFLGMITVPLTGPPGQFLGVLSERPIERIAFWGGNGELFDNLEFGPCAIAVDIDIMPSDPGNNLNLRAGKGASISVAVLSVDGFEAPNLIDPSTLEFGPGQANISGSPHVRDVDGDGDEDLVVKFLTHETGIACGDTHASLSGRTFGSELFSGSDAINTFNCPRVRKRY